MHRRARQVRHVSLALPFPYLAALAITAVNLPTR